MVTGLTVLTRLECLVIEFESPRFQHDLESLPSPPQSRTPLPVLRKLQFQGVVEYLEDLVARIDAPLLHNLAVTFFYQDIFHTAQLTQFIGRIPKFKR
jgi:hypothetical protein